MKYSIFRKQKDGRMTVEDFDYEPPESNGLKMPMAHCDQKILHAPGVCQYCDAYPHEQELRKWWGINFTGEHEPDLAPCPSTHLRDDATRDRWGGNVAQP